MLRFRISYLLTPIILTIFVYFGLSTRVSVHPAFESQLQQDILSDMKPGRGRSDPVSPPLRTAGRDIIDSNGKRIKLASVNWYGASDVDFVAMGLDVRHRKEIAATIKKMGFNSVRFPYSDQMVRIPTLESTAQDMPLSYGAVTGLSNTLLHRIPMLTSRVITLR